MTPKARRQLVVLAALVLVAGVLWMRPGSDRPAAGVAPSSNRAGAGEALPGASLAVAEVRLDQLADKPTPVPAPARDPFRFRPLPPPAPPPPPPAPRPQFDEAPVPFAQQAPMVPPIPLRLIGVVTRESGVHGVFTGAAGGEGMVFQGKAGDVIEGRYRVLRVGPDSAELAYLDGRGRQTIRMSGQ
jgi:hypothetical protein